MGAQEQIRQAIRRLGETGAATMAGRAGSLDETAGTITLIDDGDVEVPGVRLRPVLDGLKSLTILPKPGTWCLAVRIEGEESWMLMAAGEWDGWKVKTGTAEWEQDAQGFLMKKGSDELGQLMQDLIDQILLIYAPKDVAGLNALKVRFQNLLK